MSRLYCTSYLYPYSYVYPYPHIRNIPIHNCGRAPLIWVTPQQINHPYWLLHHQSEVRENRIEVKDYGKNPFVINIEEAAEQNDTFRTAIWTGDHLQVTVMSINVGEDIGLEVHPTVDQFLRIEEGQGIVQMGNTSDNVTFSQNVYEDYAIMVPAGTWHNLTNTGNKPLKLYTLYAPPEHPFGTVHKTKADAMAAE